jgi:hypothetical protein
VSTCKIEANKRARMSQFEAIDDCLWDAFANSDWFDPQEPHQLWAIREGSHRLPEPGRWRETRANKEHECIRGCTIKPGHRYFRYSTGIGWGDYLKICAGCMAMILYFLNVHKLPYYWYTHWDRVKHEPVRRSEGLERAEL